MSTPDEKDLADEARIAAVDKALGEPYMPEFGEDALKVRRNLLVVSLISIAGTLGGVTIDPKYPIFGFQFQHLTVGVLTAAIALTIVYLVVHFGWYVVDGIAGWRIRVTGTRVAFITAGTWASDDLDYPSDPRQSTLYNWWKLKRVAIGNLSNRLPTIETSLADLRSRLEKMQAPPNVVENSSNVLESLNAVQRAFVEFKHAIEAANTNDTSPRVTASLRRFDRWFAFWLRSQNLRWLLIDVSAPLFFGLTALVLLYLRTRH